MIPNRTLADFYLGETKSQNKFGHILLTTGNKSELAVGYCTIYGDMAGGLAVLTSDAKPAARVVRENDAGVVFRYDDAEDCAAAIRKLASAEFRARCGAAGRRAVAERFHWELDSARMRAAIERVAAGQS